MDIYNQMEEKGLSFLFAKTFYVDNHISIQQYFQPLELLDGQSFEIDPKANVSLIPSMYEETLSLLDTEFDSFDLKNSSDYGLNNANQLVFIDYGMSKHLYETEWVPLAEAGVLPQIDFATCRVCGLEKELRMYGDNDDDKRCYACGKE
ncbi:hypothetical protein J43TS3_28740 [Ornithinibacillus bavariensis]|uniref:Uncharacterized protein n=1 Tax=Ornithinibacillus bavariensis TaxID=545502 RepID=A0A919XCZ9_9BACI|nr:hypothetical protein J43TS3_28740 [Ornithinibacillus bavariensis]